MQAIHVLRRFHKPIPPPPHISKSVHVSEHRSDCQEGL